MVRTKPNVKENTNYRLFLCQDNWCLQYYSICSYEEYKKKVKFLKRSTTKPGYFFMLQPKDMLNLYLVLMNLNLHAYKR